MLMSKLLGERFKEKPGEASSTSHIFLLRGGYVRQRYSSSNSDKAVKLSHSCSYMVL